MLGPGHFGEVIEVCWQIFRGVFDWCEDNDSVAEFWSFSCLKAGLEMLHRLGICSCRTFKIIIDDATTIFSKGFIRTCSKPATRKDYNYVSTKKARLVDNINLHKRYNITARPAVSDKNNARRWMNPPIRRNNRDTVDFSLSLKDMGK
jgi:hypothetical protein